MRSRNTGVVGIAVLALLIALLTSGCELREGAKTEYGEYGLKSTEKITDLSNILPGQGVKNF
jgi:hypothetical protein